MISQDVYQCSPDVSNNCLSAGQAIVSCGSFGQWPWGSPWLDWDEWLKGNCYYIWISLLWCWRVITGRVALTTTDHIIHCQHCLWSGNWSTPIHEKYELFTVFRTVWGPVCQIQTQKTDNCGEETMGQLWWLVSPGPCQWVRTWASVCLVDTRHCQRRLEHVGGLVTWDMTPLGLGFIICLYWQCLAGGGLAGV